KFLAVLIVYLLLIGVAVLGSVLIAQIFAQLGVFVQYVPDVLSQASESFSKLTGWFNNIAASLRNLLAGQFDSEALNSMNESIQDQISDLLSGSAENFSELLDKIVS